MEEKRSNTTLDKLAKLEFAVAAVRKECWWWVPTRSYRKSRGPVRSAHVLGVGSPCSIFLSQGQPDGQIIELYDVELCRCDVLGRRGLSAVAGK